MVNDRNRRRFLQLAGTGTVLSVAGCNTAKRDPEETVAQQENPTTDAGDTESGGPKTVTIQVQPDQGALQERRSEIRGQVQDGNLTQQEAQQELQRAQRELVGEVATAFEERIDGEENVLGLSEPTTLAVDETIEEPVGGPQNSSDDSTDDESDDSTDDGGPADDDSSAGDDAEDVITPNEEANSDDGEGAGLGVVVALVALVGSALLARRRC